MYSYIYILCCIQHIMVYHKPNGKHENRPSPEVLHVSITGLGIDLFGLFGGHHGPGERGATRARMVPPVF